MSRSANQKLKLYRLAQIMIEKTDADHFLTMPQIIEELEKKVQYLEQIVKELIENKVDKEIIRIDEN